MRKSSVTLALISARQRRSPAEAVHKMAVVVSRRFRLPLALPA